MASRTNPFPTWNMVKWLVYYEGIHHWFSSSLGLALNEEHFQPGFIACQSPEETKAFLRNYLRDHPRKLEPWLALIDRLAGEMQRMQDWNRYWINGGTQEA